MKSNNNNKKQNKTKQSKKRKEREERPACSSPILTFLFLWICCQCSWWVASCDLSIYNQEGLAHWAVRGEQNLAELLRKQDGRRTNPFREKERILTPFPQKYWNGKEKTTTCITYQCKYFDKRSMKANFNKFRIYLQVPKIYGVNGMKRSSTKPQCQGKLLKIKWDIYQHTV